MIQNTNFQRVMDEMTLVLHWVEKEESLTWSNSVQQSVVICLAHHRSQSVEIELFCFYESSSHSMLTYTLHFWKVWIKFIISLIIGILWSKNTNFQRVMDEMSSVLHWVKREESLICYIALCNRVSSFVFHTVVASWWKSSSSAFTRQVLTLCGHTPFISGSFESNSQCH